VLPAGCKTRRSFIALLFVTTYASHYRDPQWRLPRVLLPPKFQVNLTAPRVETLNLCGEDSHRPIGGSRET